MDLVCIEYVLDVGTIGREEGTTGTMEVVDGAGGLVCGIGPNMEGALVE